MSGTLALLDLPELVLQNILSQCGPATTRTGICLPLVCKVFRSALLDLQDVTLWGTVAPLSCIPHHVMPTRPDKWFLLEKWLATRGPAIHTLHVRHPRSMWDHWKCRLDFADLLWLRITPHLTELLIDLPGSWRDPIMTEEVMAPLTGLANLQCLQLRLQSRHHNCWGWLQQLRRLTSIHISEYDTRFSRYGVETRFDFGDLAHLTMLKEAMIRLDHDGDLTPLAGLSALRSLTLPLPHDPKYDDQGTQHWQSIGGLTALNKLVLLRSYQRGRSQTLPSITPLDDLTQLTSLQLHVSIPEPASDGLIIQPSTTKLYRLAQLRVGGNFGEKVPVQQFPPGLGALSVLTSLTLCKVYFTVGVPLQSGLEALRVLEVVLCKGPLCIACALPSLQRIGFAYCRDLQLLSAFQSALYSQVDTRCEVVGVRIPDDARLPSNQPLPLTLQLSRWHSIVLLSRPTWLALHSSESGLLCSALSLQYLEDLDLQDCGLTGFPTQLQPASALRRLRIAGMGAALHMTPDDLQTLSALQRLGFLSITQPGRANQRNGATPFEMRSWSEHSIQDLCYILWELRARSLLVVLKEPSNVGVPLAVAAGYPADALGRCALTTEAITDGFLRASITPKPWKDCSPEEESVRRAALDSLLPRRGGTIADTAELDGAAAMWAAVPGHVAAWLQLLADT